MHRVAGLEGDDLAPSALAETITELTWSHPHRLEVVVVGEIETLDPTADVPAVRPLKEIGDAGMLRVGGAEHRLRLTFEVGLPDVVHVHDGQHHAFTVAQGEHGTLGEAMCSLLVHVEGDRHRPQGPVGEPHLVDNAVVVGAPEEPLQRGEAAVDQKLEVAELAFGQVPRRVVA